MEYAIGVLYPDTHDYDKAIEISKKLYEIEKPIGAVDILIASICINRGLKLKTKDNDFNAVKQVFPKFNLQLLK